MKAFDRRGLTGQGLALDLKKKRIYILRAALHVDVGYAPFSSDDSVHRPSNLKEGVVKEEATLLAAGAITE